MHELQVTLDQIGPTARRVAGLAHALFGGRYADIIWRETDKLSRLVPFEGDDNARFPSRRVMMTGEPIWIEDFDDDPLVREFDLVRAGADVRCLMAVPIISGKLVLGVLGAIDHRPRSRDEAMLRRFAELATLVAEAFEAESTNRELQRIAGQLERALSESKRSEQRLEVATRLAGVRVWQLSDELREAYENGTTMHLGDGYAGRIDAIWEFLHPDDRAGAREMWRAHVEEGQPFHRTHRRMGPEGFRWVETAVEAVRDAEGRVCGAVGAVRDIEQEKRREAELIQARNAAEAANEAKSAFLATISHEIRTPLNGILGMAQAMHRDDLPAPQRARLDVIRQSGETLLAVVNDVLDLSKISAGKLELEDVEFDLAAAITSAHAAFAPVAAEKGLAFDVEVGSCAQGVYRGDPIRVRQILYNLISNALKFTEAGEVRVRLSRAADELRIEVSDTGMGIPLDRQQALFQPFVQADASTTRKYGGSGLGLSICRELATLMGGSIAVASAPGAGSTFTVRLKLPYVRSATPGEPSPSVRPQTVAQLPALRILAAEDNPVNQMVLRTLLEQVGAAPVIVENGRLAVEAWAAGEWDLILMDAQMPVMDGLEATSAIRAAERAQGRARTPIIALTANAMAHQTAAYRDCGMDATVAKPLEVARLFAAMEDVLAAADARPAAAG